MGTVRSMTGFGRASVSQDGINVKAEVKSVNHRYKEINVRVPKHLMFLEPHVRRIVSERIERGKIDIYLQIEFEGTEGKEIAVNKELAKLLWERIREMATEMGAPLPHAGIIMKEAITVKEEVDEEKLLSITERVINEALEGLIAFRCEEGERLRKDILKRLGRIEEFVEKANSLAEIAAEEAKKKLMERLSDLEIDDARIAQEIAIMLDKLDVSEELVRLKSHIKAFAETLEKGSPCGKKLDFIVQEMLREANTLGVKSAAAQLTLLVVDLKTEIEKIREQVQNLE